MPKRIKINTIYQAMQGEANADVSFIAKVVTEVEVSRDDQNRTVFKFEVADQKHKIHITSYNKSSRDIQRNSTYLFTNIVNKKSYMISK